MQKRSHLPASKGFSSCKIGYKSRGPNIKQLNPKDTYQLLWRLSPTLIWFLAFAEFKGQKFFMLKDAYGKKRANTSCPGFEKLGRHVAAMHNPP